jgi:CHC2 zinc finger
MTNLFYHRCRVSTFKVQCFAHQKITEIENSKLRASSYKLYRWLCSRAAGFSISAKLQAIRKATGLGNDAIINARRELRRINLISTNREGGPGGSYQFAVLNADNGLFAIDWSSKPWPRYFVVPHASTLTAIYPQKWTGTDALIYDALLVQMTTTGKNELSLTSHWFKEVSKNTLPDSEQTLEDTGFIRVKNGGKNRAIEILNPETSQSMPPKGADQEPTERVYYIDKNTTQRRLLTDEGFTPEILENYFRKSLPRGEEWLPGRNAHCPFHDDQTPSLGINVETGQFICYGCGVKGNKLATFEMQLLDTDDVQEAWGSVAKKLGITLCPRSRGKVTQRHIYRDEKGDECYMVLRYADDTASYQRYMGFGGLGGIYKAGLKGRKRILYNLPQVIAAEVVLFVEGEKKADILRDLRFLDSDGRLVAITTTGGAGSWRIENVEYLTGKRVVFLPDTDEPGLRYSAEVQVSLQRAGIEFQVVDFADHGNDFRDYLTAHGVVALLRFIDCGWLMSAEDRERREEAEIIRI